MSKSSAQELTHLLLAWRQGEREALDQLIPVIYEELRRLAHSYLRGERKGHTLQTTALVNEAYLRLLDCSRVNWQNRAHFLAVSAQLMRRILVDYARSRGYQKRGGAWSESPSRKTKSSRKGAIRTCWNWTRRSRRLRWWMRVKDGWWNSVSSAA